MKVFVYAGMMALAVLLLSTGIVSTVSAESSQNSIEVTVLFQFGNQQVMSANVELPADNHTAILATELACEELGLDLNYSWSTYGAYVSQIGWEKNDWYGTGYYWHLMLWSNDSAKWVPSPTGASQVNMSYGGIIAWVYTVDNPSWLPYTGSLAYPGHYGVWSTPRGNMNGTGVGVGESYVNYTPDVVWKFKGQSSWGFSSTTVSGDGEIFIADSSGLYALNMNGSLIWNTTLGAAGYYGIASPVIFGNYVLIGTSDEYLRAFFVNNGTLAWQIYLGEDIASAPAVGIVNKIPTAFVATFKLNSVGRLYAVNILNGSIEWNLTLMGSAYFGNPAIYDGNIIVPIAGIEDSSYTWNAPYGIQCIAGNGTYLWNYSTSSSVRSSPAVENGNIYFVTVGGKLISLTQNGTLRWDLDVGSSVSSPAVSGRYIYLGNNNGTLYGIEDDGNFASIIWEDQLNGPVQGGVICFSNTVFAVTNTQNGTLYATFANGTPYWSIILQPADYILSSPIVADSYLLVASNNGYLYALGNNATYPSIGTILQSTAYVGSPVEIKVQAQEQYQAVLYYKNVTGDYYHAVWMSYENGYYVGYIPAQSTTGNVYYYITLVNSSGVTSTTSLRVAQILQPVPEFSSFAIIAVVLLLMVIFRNRARG